MNRTKNSTNLLVGLLLVGGGVLFLLSNLGLFDGLGSVVWSLIWVLAFGAGSALFLITFLRDYRENWWAAIPGMTLLGLALAALFGEIMPGLSGLSGPIFLASIGAGFVLVYIAVPENWWALIPAGVMLTLGAVAGVDEAGIAAWVAISRARSFSLASARLSWYSPCCPTPAPTCAGPLFPPS